MSESVRPMAAERKMKYSVISVEILSLLLQALRQMFIVGCQFDERFPYENVEALTCQSLAFLRLGPLLGEWMLSEFSGSPPSIRITEPATPIPVTGWTPFLGHGFLGPF